jgi:hypothetical protein
MIRKILFIAIFVVSFASQAATKKSFIVDVSLFPAGSFQIKSSKIKGKVSLNTDGTLEAKNIRIPIKSLKTGIDLRDEHLKKKLGYESDSKVNLLLLQATGKSSKGNATFEVLGEKQTVPFTYKKIDKKYGQAEFQLDLKKFKISGISYMGVGVEDMVKVKVVLPYKLKK